MSTSLLPITLVLIATMQVDPGAQVDSNIVDVSSTQNSDGVATAERETIVLHLEHLPSEDAAEAIGRWLRVEEKVTKESAANVVSVAVTNDLVASGTASQLRTISSIVSQLDRPKRQVRVNTMLVEFTAAEATNADAFHRIVAQQVVTGDLRDVLSQLREHGEVTVMSEPSLLCFDNQPAFVQSGSRVPRVTGVSSSPRGSMNAVTLENVGTMLGVTCRISNPDMITLEIDLERSYLGPENEGTPLTSNTEGPVVRSPQVKTLSIQTTVALQSGRTVVLGGTSHQGDAPKRVQLFLLQPQLVKDSASEQNGVSANVR